MNTLTSVLYSETLYILGWLVFIAIVYPASHAAAYVLAAFAVLPLIAKYIKERSHGSSN